MLGTPNKTNTRSLPNQTPVRPHKQTFARHYLFLLGDPNTLPLLALASTLLARCSGVGFLTNRSVSFINWGSAEARVP